MKVISLVALLSSILIHAQNPDPPNGIYLKDNLYMDATEVANIHWLEYEHYITRDSSEEFVNASLPSIEVTKNYRPEYYRYPKYRYYPVVGISHEQAMNYCKWRTAIVNSKLEADGDKRRMKYRLPTEKEWELAAKSIDTLKVTRPKSNSLQFMRRASRKMIQDFYPDREINFRKLKEEIVNYKKKKVPYFIVDYPKLWFATTEEKLPRDIFGPRRPNSSQSNPIDEYQHLIGNVAEMVQEEGIVKGGSWRHILATSFPSKRSEIDPDKVYDWVGFRCIGEVTELEK